MADNTVLPGTGENYRAEDIGGAKYQLVKIAVGEDGTAVDLSITNPLPVGGALVSTVNSTTATLAGAAVFTGTGEEVLRFASISVSWNADVAGSLVMQFSTDNTNWDRSIPVSSGANLLQTNHGGVHRLSVIARYFRLVYTNGPDAQTSFRLQVLLHQVNNLALVSRLEQQLNTSSDCVLSRSITNIDLDLARRSISGQRAFFFNGFNNVFGNAVWEDVHPSGGDINWLTAATIVEVLSSDAADTNSAGAGVRAVEIHGLSATGADQDEVILLNGTTPVQSSLSYCRINQMHNEVVGTYGGSHRGDVTIRVTGGGVVLGVMTGLEGAVDTSVQYGSGETQNGYYSVPLGKVLYISNIVVDINAKTNQTANVALYEREGILNSSGDMDPRRAIWSATEVVGEITKTFKSHVKIKGLTDLFFRGFGSAAGMKMSVHLDHYLLDANAAGE